jgi:dihydrofolate synthase/folylpolyglutamate synthase
VTTTKGPTATPESTRRAGDESAALATLLDRLEMWGQRLGLERIRELLERLGAPQARVPLVLVAGTNGKGSTAAFLSAILSAGGCRVGLYTSPHLESVEERIRLDGRSIDTARFLELLERVLTAAQGMSELPTYFEAVTAAAFLCFAEARLDVAVAEVGLGGRLDATNASEPTLSVITSIAFDHQEHLGPRLLDIAREKAGILRRGREALACAGDDEVRDALRAAAAAAGSELRFVEDEVAFGPATAEPDGDRWRYRLRTPEDSYDVRARLRGAHQAVNLALAVRAAERLRALGVARSDHDAIVHGIERARWPARLEAVALPGNASVLLDGAHNEAGIVALCDYLRSVPAPAGRDLLFGALQGKRAEHSLARLAPAFARITLTEPRSPKALPAEALRDAAPGAVVLPANGEALEAALRGAGPRELVVCGSLYLVGEVRGLLRQRFGTPVAAVDVETG